VGKIISPLVIFIIFEILLSNVDFPQPFEPNRAKISPLFTSNEIFLNISFLP